MAVPPILGSGSLTSWRHPSLSLAAALLQRMLLMQQYSRALLCAIRLSTSLVAQATPPRGSSSKRTEQCHVQHVDLSLGQM